MKQCLFTVQQRDDTRWHICETGSAGSLASFGLKEDAVEYARDLAQSWMDQIDRSVAGSNGREKHSSDEEAKRIAARAAASLAEGAAKKPAMSRA